MLDLEAASPARICVIIVNYNGADFIASCLDALALQTLRPSRVIVVDNNSSDSSADIASKHPIRAEVISNSDNLGFAAANNQAIHSANDCEWLALLNPDTEADRDWLSQLHDASATYPDFHSFASLQRVAANPEICDGAGDLYHAVGYGWRKAHNTRSIDDLPDNEEVFSSCAAACLLKRDSVVEIGGFDEDFFCYCEDLDLGFRLRLAGHKAMFIKSAQVLHHQSGISGLNSDFSVYHGQRNLVWVFVKNMPTLMLILMLIPHLFLNIFAILAYTIAGRGKLIINAKYDALKGLPRTLNKRFGNNKKCGTGLALLVLRQLQYNPWTLLKRMRNR